MFRRNSQTINQRKKIATEAIAEALWRLYKAPSDNHIDAIAGRTSTFIVR